MTQKKDEKLLTLRVVLTAVILIAFLLVFFLGGGIDYFNPKNFYDQAFETHFIDVGQGDAIFMRLPSGQTALIDCGPNEKGNNVVEYLQNLFAYEHIDTLDFLVFTHPDEDHVGKGKDIIENFDVKIVYRPKIICQYEVEKLGLSGEPDKTAAYNDAIKACYDEEIEMRYNEKLLLTEGDNFKVEFLSPLSDQYDKDNNYSPMIMVNYQNTKMLLTGDCEQIAEHEVVQAYGEQLKADILKVGHHGSKTSSSEEFLAAVQPKYAVISVAEDNQYKLPDSETLDKLGKYNAQVMKTSDLGSIILTVDASDEILFMFTGVASLDLPLIIVIFSLSILVVWGVKVKKKNK